MHFFLIFQSVVDTDAFRENEGNFLRVRGKSIWTTWEFIPPRWEAEYRQAIKFASYSMKNTFLALFLNVIIRRQQCLGSCFQVWCYVRCNFGHAKLMDIHAFCAICSQCFVSQHKLLSASVLLELCRSHLAIGTVQILNRHHTQGDIAQVPYLIGWSERIEGIILHIVHMPPHGTRSISAEPVDTESKSQASPLEL